ncbi:ATP-binding protein [Cryptosporangium arvum]|uniref:Putative transcriptional regulator n=1 Tax=Cryptosporangium arvum DSM 44712 TaxID=927661 RepID=A0A010Z4K0_9ACTN|nr:AAA family ATPase [Cryptosporangium arvum]EXG82268.1 putative transcriptional regulator [Cryptosporangium arvum DSM 44712]
MAELPVRSAADGALRLHILGPLRVGRAGVGLDVGPPRQARLLALLLAQAGRPLSTAMLVDLLWGDDAPASAPNVVQRYVGALRRLLEPELPAREPGSYLRRQDSGYLFVPGEGMLDLVAFRQRVEAARAALAEQRPEAALSDYIRALELWEGPAADGLRHGAGATGVFAALDGEFFDACVAAAELSIRLERPQQVLRPLRLASAMDPSCESVNTALHAVLTAAGPPSATADDATVTRESVVGRAAERVTLQRAVSASLDGGTGLVFLEGEPGVGKTRLLEEAALDADRRGVLVLWGRCREGDGAPAMWPWIQIVEGVLDARGSADRDQGPTGELVHLVRQREGDVVEAALPVEGSQFRLFRQVVDLLARTAAPRPVLVLLDDLQWADTASLQLLGYLAEWLPERTVVVGALREHGVLSDPELTRMLSTVSRVSGHRRIHLGPLGPDEVTELVRREIGRDPAPEVARGIYTRTAGNPFFVRELARLLADGGVFTPEALTRGGVPSTVRDVVRDRMDGLGDRTSELLRTASVVGRDVDLRLLAGITRLDVASCLAALEPVHALGLLATVPGDPFSVRFTHDLVRESVARDIPQARAARLHLAVADGLEKVDLGDVFTAERRAHHLWAAGPLADPARTAAALVAAGRRAAARSALVAAEQQLQSAAQLARDADLPEWELAALSQLTAVVGMRTGYRASAFDALERAEQLARTLGREREAADFLFSRRAAYSQAGRLDRSGPLARRLLEQGSDSPDPLVCAYGLLAWGIHQWDVGDVGEAFRYLGRANRTLVEDLAERAERPLRYDLQLMSLGMLAEVTALHGDVDAARALLDGMEIAAGEDSYAITVWTSFAARIAAMAGDPEWALRVAREGIAEDPEFSYRFFGLYLRLARLWALAVTGREPAVAAAEAERLIEAMLLDPPRSNVPTWCGLLAEAWLAADRPAKAAAALDRAEHFLESTGQRYAEALLLLLRARLLRATGGEASSVAERAGALAREREAHLFARRAADFLAGPDAGDRPA